MKTGRLNHIDALRGSVMLLLVPYHGLLFLQNSGAVMHGLDLSVFWLHLWRMGLFFAVSGFLAAMTIQLWGPTKQVAQRLKRIALPLTIAMLTILPVQKLIVIWYSDKNLNGPGDLLGWEPHHLWFLSYVLAFNLVAVVLWLLIRRGPWLSSALDKAFRRFVSSRLLIPGLAVISSIPLWLGGYLEAPGQVAASLIPIPSPFAYYGIFFVFGWMLWRSQDLLPIVENGPWSKLAVAIPSGLVAYLLFSKEIVVPDALPAGLVILSVASLAAWTMIFAVWGFFAKFLSGARPWVRYLADASYWIYLIHIPILVAVQLGLARTDLPPLLRVTIATSVAIAAALATYALIVRYSPIGTLLHGKRRRSSQAPPTPVPAPEPLAATIVPASAEADAPLA